MGNGYSGATKEELEEGSQHAATVNQHQDGCHILSIVLLSPPGDTPPELKLAVGSSWVLRVSWAAHLQPPPSGSTTSPEALGERSGGPGGQ